MQLNIFSSDSEIEDFRIGVRRVDKVWMYANGRTISVNNKELWKSGEPDSYTDCGVYRKYSKNGNYNYGLADTSCNTDLPKVCEKM